MNISALIDDSMHMAYDYLERAGELRDASKAGVFLLHRIERQVVQSERRRLIPSDKAIDNYQELFAEAR